VVVESLRHQPLEGAWRAIHAVLAPGKWTSSAKSGVGTAHNRVSRVWFTLSHGILNEVYYPHLDQACIRDLGFIVTDGKSFFSEEKRHTRSELRSPLSGIPAFDLVNTCADGRYRIEKRILSDPQREVVVLQSISFRPLVGALAGQRSLGRARLFRGNSLKRQQVSGAESAALRSPASWGAAAFNYTTRPGFLPFDDRAGCDRSAALLRGRFQPPQTADPPTRLPRSTDPR
jgi:hypothetical protein